MTKTLRMVPYGEASYTKLREAGFAYVDKTRFISVLEQNGSRFPIILRPRRSGKSLFANLLTAYYDKAAAKDFEKNFSGTWIGEHPTPLANKYLVLMFDFSSVAKEDFVGSFIGNVKDSMMDFVLRYMKDDEKVVALINAPHSSPSALLLEFLRRVSVKLNEKIYLIIDEYDAFAHELSPNDPDDLRRMNAVKNFYANIKDAAQSRIAWVYITGVTPVSLDGMTSGYNIGSNLSDWPAFSAMAGFTEEELCGLIPQTIDVERYGHCVDEIVDRMKVLYDGYRFSPDSDVTVCNSSMCLYYLGEIAAINKEPDVLLDPAFSVGLSKIEGILSLGRREFVNDVVTKVLLDQSIPLGALSGAVNLNAAAELADDDILSALVFMGFLTFSQERSDRLVCPNLVVKDIFFKYWFRWIGKANGLSFPPTVLENARRFLESGDITPILTLVSERLTQCVGSHAHAHLSGRVIPFAVCMAMNTSWNYQAAVVEEAMGAGFKALVLRPRKPRPEVAGWLIEFKHLKKSEAKPSAIEAKLSEAEEQLTRYAEAENIADIPNLRKAAVVFSGTELKGLKVF